MEVFSTTTLETIDALKACPVSPGAIVVVVGKAAVSDGLGGFYRWNAAATGSEDTTYLVTIASSVSPTGRWERVFQNAKVLPHGVLTTVGGVKTFYARTAIEVGSQKKLYLTYDGLETGVPIFKDIWKNDSKAQQTITNVSDAITSYLKELPESNGYKWTTHGYYKSNVVTLTLAQITAGLLYGPFAAATTGTVVCFEIVGI